MLLVYDIEIARKVRTLIALLVIHIYAYFYTYIRLIHATVYFIVYKSHSKKIAITSNVEASCEGINSQPKILDFPRTIRDPPPTLEAAIICHGNREAFKRLLYPAY